MGERYYDSERVEENELILPADQPFSLGQLILATRLPSRMVYKVQADGHVEELLQFEGTWFIQASSIVIQNHAHFSRYVKKGPGMWILDQSRDIAVPMNKEELTTMYRFYIPHG